ncbi:MAG: S-layer homology domain-containing protein [Actinobacteria bacterium]|nr:S-layer homology domain-containing protein [Actinomycetota bacterium]
MRRTLVLFSLTLALTLGLLLSGTPMAAPETAIAAPTFSDVPENHPYFNAIEDMAASNVISGFTNGTFGPEMLVTRQQFAKMIVLTLGLPVDEDDFPSPAVPFVDLGSDDPSSLYPHEYVAVCALNNITKGKTATTFDPYSNITRAQAVTMIVRAAQNLQPDKLVEPPSGFVSDWGNFSDIHAPLANTAQWSGLLERLKFAFYKENPLTSMANRGEVAQLLWSLKFFVKQTKTMDELVTITDVTTSGAPPQIKAAFEAKAGGPMDWIRRMYVEHPVNAMVHFNFYYAGRGGNYYASASSLEGPVIAPLIATFLTYIDDFGAEAGYALYDATDPQNPQVAGELDWRLGGPYLRQGAETLDQYANRIQPLMDDFLANHADADELFFLSDPAVRDLIKTSDSLGINQGSDALMGVRVRVDFYRQFGGGDVIDDVADEFWPWD